jgi:cell division control protein 7
MSGIKDYMRSLFRGLRDIHARGIIHRDIKPANFLFDPRTGIGTIVDLGLACVCSLRCVYKYPFSYISCRE